MSGLTRWTLDLQDKPNQVLLAFDVEDLPPREAFFDGASLMCLSKTLDLLEDAGSKGVFSLLRAHLFVDPMKALVAVTVGLLAECLPLPIDDNLLIPLAVGLTLILFSLILMAKQLCARINAHAMISYLLTVCASSSASANAS